MVLSSRLFRLAALLLACGSYGFSQTCPPGELRVFVKDSQEAPIFDAEVQVLMGAVEVGKLSTNTTGMVNFANIPCGSLTIKANKQGFGESSTDSVVDAKGIKEVTVVLIPQTTRSSLDVNETAPPVQQSASPDNELRPSEVTTLPTNPATVADLLPLVPGVVRALNGELKIDGAGEERSALVVNQTDVTDPATGRFGQTVPVDSIETVNVLTTPFLSQYGRFTQSVVAVETKRGGDKWHADLNDPFPDFRIRSYHMRGIRNETPHGSVGGPIIAQKLYFITALQYFIEKAPSRTLQFPNNESKTERINSFTQLDYIVSARQIVNATLHISPEHTNFVNPDFFNPQVVTPSYAQHNYVGALAHHLGIFGGTLDSTFSLMRFDAVVGAQGDRDMIITPQGNRGNYFGRQNRQAWRRQWLEIWSPAPVVARGTHLPKIGTSFTYSGEKGQFTYHPADILDANGVRIQRIDFTNQEPFLRNDKEFTFYAQDHWALNSRIALDYGVRFEEQRLASSSRVAPRAGFAWTPFKDERTVVRAGYGQFYDHIPLDVYSFSRYPLRTVTNYAPDGSVIGAPVEFENVIGSVTGPKSFLIRGERVAGAFSPRGVTWNAQIEHSFAKLLRIRAVYTDNRSVGLVVVEPDLLNAVRKVVLNGDGSSRFRQAEFTAKLAMQKEQFLVMSYTRSRAEGNLNSFDSFLGNYPIPFLRPNEYSSLAGDLPNRFLLWGRLDLPVWSLKMAPIIEYRNGFPYANVDAFQNYVGVPNSNATRFPNFFAADTRLMRDFKVRSKYTVRLSVTGYNLTNHFNALALHANTADPQHGVFFGNYKRRYRFDFEVLF